MKADTITIKIVSGDIYAEKNTESTVMGKDSQGQPTKIKVTSLLQEIDKATGTLIANGDVVIHYDNYIAKGPKAVFYRTNNKLDRIVLSGRAQMDDADRIVYGDQVIILTDPKQFHAVGNVTTFIKQKQNGGNASSSGKPASKGGKTAKTTKATKTVHAAAPVKTPAQTQASSQDALNQELLIEQETKPLVKTP